MIAKVKLKKNDRIIIERVKIVSSFWGRLIGLMFKDDIDTNEGIIIRPCNSIHTFFMKFPIDVVFLTKDLKIVKIYRDLKPWKMTGISFKTKDVLEIKGGTLPLDVNEGDDLEFVCIN